MAMPAGIDPSKMRPVDWEVTTPNPKIRIEIKDGAAEAIMEVEVVINNVVRCGNNPQDGSPIYIVNVAPVGKLKKAGPGLYATQAGPKKVEENLYR